MTENSNPRFEVWSTVAWDGKDSLLAANLHFDRMERHARRLNFSLPDNFRKTIFTKLGNLTFSETSVVQEDQPPYLVKIGITNEGIFSLIPRLNQPWPSILKAITVSAPIWDGEIRGTKHGDWKPYFDARKLAFAPHINIGVFSLEKNSNGWSSWQNNLSTTLSEGNIFGSEGLAINMSVYIDDLETEFLPLNCNWITSNLLPKYDQQKKTFVEPYLPNNKIGIMHLAAGIWKDGKDMRTDKSIQIQLKTLDNKIINKSLRYNN